MCPYGKGPQWSHILHPPTALLTSPSPHLLMLKGPVSPRLLLPTSYPGSSLRLDSSTLIPSFCYFFLFIHFFSLPASAAATANSSVAAAAALYGS